MARLRFYSAIAVFTALGVAMNFPGFNSMKALVIAGIIHRYYSRVFDPALDDSHLLMTSNRAIMGNRVNGRAINILGGSRQLRSSQRVLRWYLRGLYSWRYPFDFALLFEPS
jgi:hypothetical protein